MARKAQMGSLKDQVPTRSWHREWNILEITNAICGAMNDRCVTRHTLAKRLGWTVTRLDEFLDGQGVTLPRILKVAFAMNLNLKLSLAPKEASHG